MKKLVLVAVLGLTLAACDNAAEESDEPVTEDTTAAAPVEESMAGTYEFEMDGTPTTAVLMDDGTYSDTQNGEVIEAGTWQERDDGKVCFDPEGDDTPDTCFTIGETAADGTFVATPDEGEPLTIRKVG